jgi:hypothetical protein
MRAGKGLTHPYPVRKFGLDIGSHQTNWPHQWTTTGPLSLVWKLYTNSRQREFVIDSADSLE